MITLVFPFLLIILLTPFISFYAVSLPNNLFYLFDKDLALSDNPLYHQYCLGFLRTDISCFILRTHILNYFISKRKSHLIYLQNYIPDSCYHLPYISYNFTSTLFTPDNRPSSVVLYPFIKSFPNNSSSNFSHRISSLFNHSSSSFINFDDKLDFGTCVFVISELCRAHDLFSSSINNFIEGSPLKILSISGKRTSFPDKINYDIFSDIDSFIPSLDYFNDYILSALTDQFYIYKNEMLKRLEYSLRNRECILLNEIDLLFFDVTQFPLNTYREIQKFMVHIMDGFNHFTYIVFKKLQEIWVNIEKSELGTAINLTEKFINVYNHFENDLNSPLKLIMDASDYRDILEISSTYFAFYSKQMETKTSLSRIEINKLIGPPNDLLGRLSILLYRQCRIPSVLGPVATSEYFKNLEDKISKF